MKIVFLGTGTSTGVPLIGCECAVCRSENEKDKRLRASILVTNENARLLIDCGPDLRQQFLRAGTKEIDGILITHEHYDHIGGLDDVRPLGECNVYAEKRVLGVIRSNLHYAFSDHPYPGVPTIHLHEINEKDDFNVCGTVVKPLRVMHAKLPVLGFRIANVAYLTDVKTISNQTIEQLKGLDVLILNALRINEHISHISLSEAIGIATQIGATRTYFTHFSHDLGMHNEVQKTLPENMFLSYDHLELTL